MKCKYFINFIFFHPITTKIDKKPKPESVEIYTIKITERRVKVIKISLEDIWKKGSKLRINNFDDKNKKAHSEKDIKNQVIQFILKSSFRTKFDRFFVPNSQIAFAQKTKNQLWHNTQHFVYWCRYGDRQQDIRKRQVIFIF